MDLSRQTLSDVIRRQSSNVFRTHNLRVNKKINDLLKELYLLNSNKLRRIKSQILLDDPLARQIPIYNSLRNSFYVFNSIISHLTDLNSYKSIRYQEIFSSPYLNKLVNKYDYYLEGKADIISSSTVGDIITLSDKKIIVSNPARIIIWNTETVEKESIIRNNYNGSLLLLKNDRIALQTLEGTIIIFDIFTGTRESQWKTEIRPLEDKFILWNDQIVTFGRSPEIKIWDTQGKLLQTLIGHTNVITCCIVFGSKLISGSLDMTIRIWNSDGNCETVFQDTSPIIRIQEENGKLISLSNTITIWDKGKLELVLPNIESHNLGPLINSKILYFGDRLICAHETDVVSWNLKTLDFIIQDESTHCIINNLDVLPNGDIIIFSKGGEVVILNPDTLKTERFFRFKGGNHLLVLKDQVVFDSENNIIILK